MLLASTCPAHNAQICHPSRSPATAEPTPDFKYRGCAKVCRIQIRTYFLPKRDTIDQWEPLRLGGGLKAKLSRATLSLDDDGGCQSLRRQQVMVRGARVRLVPDGDVGARGRHPGRGRACALAPCRQRRCRVSRPALFLPRRGLCPRRACVAASEERGLFIARKVLKCGLDNAVCSVLVPVDVCRRAVGTDAFAVHDCGRGVLAHRPRDQLTHSL